MPRVPTALLAAFGAGATGAVWLGQLTACSATRSPAALSSGGAVLTGVALAIVLVGADPRGAPAGGLARARRRSVRRVLLLPWGLGPLGSLVLLIALAPLTRPVEPA